MKLEVTQKEFALLKRAISGNCEIEEYRRLYDKLAIVELKNQILDLKEYLKEKITETDDNIKALGTSHYMDGRLITLKDILQIIEDDGCTPF